MDIKLSLHFESTFANLRKSQDGVQEVIYRLTPDLVSYWEEMVYETTANILEKLNKDSILKSAQSFDAGVDSLFAYVLAQAGQPWPSVLAGGTFGVQVGY